MSIKTIAIGIGVVLLLLLGTIIYVNRSSLPGTKSTEKGTVKIKDKTIKVEVVKTSVDTQIGLSKKRSLGDDRGMLFIFSKPDYYSFWMRNMQFPIDMIFIRGDKIVTIHEKVAAPKTKDETNLPIYRPEQPVDKVLEIKAGVAEKNGFREDDRVDISL